jgi:hypothetical protein
MSIIGADVFQISAGERFHQIALPAWLPDTAICTDEGINAASTLLKTAVDRFDKESTQETILVVPDTAGDEGHEARKALTTALSAIIGDAVPLRDFYLGDRRSGRCYYVGSPKTFVSQLRIDERRVGYRINLIRRRLRVRSSREPMRNLFEAARITTQVSCWSCVLEKAFAALDTRSRVFDLTTTEAENLREAAAMGWALGFAGVVRRLRLAVEGGSSDHRE